MTSPVVVCGRCGATNPQDAEFCESCGAFMAAYQAPAGATGAVEALNRPVEAAPHSETVYVPPTPPSPELAPVTIEFEPEPVIDEAAAPPDVIDAQDETATAAAVGGAEVAEPASITVAEPLTATSSANPTHYPARPGKYQYTAPPSLPKTEPAVIRTPPATSAETPRVSSALPGTGRTSASPQTIILIGIAALLGVCAAAAVASSNSAFFLLIGGPIAFSLIAIGVLMLVGRYPTGRP